MATKTLTADLAREVPASAVDRLRSVFDAELDFVWRSLRRLGLDEATADDAAQRVFLVLARRLDGITVGSERAFLFATAVRIASEERRSAQRRRTAGEEELDAIVDPRPGPEEQADLRHARARLARVLDEMVIDLRAVFILYELEEMTLAEIAACLGIPAGTVASRLRRARQAFADAVARLQRSEP